MLVGKKAEVSVCFADKDHTETAIIFNEDGSPHNIAAKNFGPWSQDLKEKVKSWINEAYSTEKTGVHFVGWGNCRDKIQGSDVAIYVSSKEDRNISETMRMTGQASIGMNGHLDQKTSKKAFAYFLHPEILQSEFKKYESKMINFELYYKGTVIHEFGHLAGLEHEHSREEIEKDENCRKIVDEYSFRTYITSAFYNYTISLDEFYKDYQNTYPVPAVKVTEYDPVSLMNYCTLQSIKVGQTKKAELSADDIKTLKFLYQN